MHSHPDKLVLARNAVDESLWMCVKDTAADVVLNAIYNRNLSEEMAVYIAKKNSTPPEVLGMLAEDSRFKASYKLKICICRNPKTPPGVTLSLLKFLRIFDLGDITKNQSIPINVRQKIEAVLLEKTAALPSGVKIALSKRVSIRIILAFLEKSDNNVIRSCLESPLLTEEHLCRLINKPAAGQPFIRMISQDAKWSLRYRIRYSLVKNYHTPMHEVMKFISGLKTEDLRELYCDRSLPSSSKPYIFSEITSRRDTVETKTRKRYNLSGDEDSDLDDPELIS
jgi:hypothetical protein